VKTAVFRRDLELFPLLVGPSPTPVTRPLRSTSITPASSLLWCSPRLIDASVFQPRGIAACAFSLHIIDQGLKFRAKA
jgi:hypothetical protein